MSAIAGVFGRGSGYDDRLAMRRMLAVMHARGAERTESVAAGGACSGVARFEWELTADFSGSAPIVSDEDLCVVADASNPASLAGTAGGLMSTSDETFYQSVRTLRGGTSLSWSSGRISIRSFWEPNPAETAGAPPLEEGALELRRLLTRSVAEQLGGDGVTTQQQSGGS
jgi:hypothetical protein